MARISLEEFGAGLPVTRANPVQPIQDPESPQGSTFSRVLRDIPGDVVDTFKGVIDAGREGGENFAEAFSTPDLSVGQRVAGAIVSPFSALANAGGEVLKGGMKVFTTDEFEEQTNKALAEVGQAAMNSQMGQKAREYYDSLDEQQKFTLTNIIAPTANVMTAGVAPGVGKAAFDTAKTALKQGFKSTARETVKRTPREAAEAVIKSANPVAEAVSSPVVDTLKGAGTQIKDFAKRTALEAQDTAKQSKRLAEMPEPKANLIKNGADERIVNVVENSTPEEIPLYRELIEQAKLKEADPTPNTAQPKVIAGREFLKPVDFIIKQRNTVGTDLGQIRKGLSTTKNIDTNPAFRAFHQYLKDDFKVQFDKEGKIIPEVGTLATGDVPQIQKLYDQLKSDKLNSQAELDQWLQRSLKDFDLVQKREQTFSDEVTRIAGRARQEIGELMPAEYNQLRTEYAQLSKPLNDFVKLIGYKGDLDKLTTKDLKTGEVALRVLGNAADRPQSVIDDVLNTATDNGYTSTVDLNRLIYITDQLEDLYDITPTRGFSGSATRGINQSSAGTAADVATFNVGNLFDRAMSSRATQKEIQESFEAYIKHLEDGGQKGTFKPAQEVKVEQVNLEEVVGSMMEQAPEAKKYIDDIADAVAVDIDDVRVAKAPIKSQERALQKVVEEEGGDATNLRDLARNSLVPLTPESMQASVARMDEILKEVTDSGLYGRKKIQEPEKFSGYGGTIYNIETPNGLVAEIQIVEPGMLYGKMLPEDSLNILGKDLIDEIKASSGLEPGVGHELYEQLRSLSIAELEGPKGQALMQESVDYYNKLR